MLLYIAPPNWTAKIWSPCADIALEIQMAEPLLPAVQVAPPSLETRIGPPASPAATTLPASLVESECQILGVATAKVQLGVALALKGSAAARGMAGGAAGKLSSPPPPQALN